MNQITVDYQSLVLSQQVLERQRDHAHRIAAYVRNNTDIGDATGLLLSALDPLSRAATEAAALAMEGLAKAQHLGATGVGETARDFRDQDSSISDHFSDLTARTGRTVRNLDYVDLTGHSLPAAGSSAGKGHGDVSSWIWEKGADMKSHVTDGAGDVRHLVDQASQWGTQGSVREVSNASSYLVAPQNPENPVQDLRWSAGAILGGIDWVAEKVIGYSILDRCIYEPFAGDWQAIFRASQAWKHAGEASFEVARNNAGLVAFTPTKWDGLSGNSFRGAMGAAAAASLGLQMAFETASGLVKNIATACKLAATGIGMALNTIANILLKKAAELATPIAGWAVGAVTAYSDIEKVIKTVRLIYTIIETIADVISDFIEAKTTILKNYYVVEDLVEGLGRSVTA